MIVNHDNYMIRSANSNEDGPNWDPYWEQTIFPAWSALSGLGVGVDIPTGMGVEPHYHDCDEFWLFMAGSGEAWLDGCVYEITPQTVVYTPMGLIHRFQFFTNGSSMAPLVTRLERQKRPGHLVVEQAGPPRATVPGFVVPGAQNTGPFVKRGPRCPLSELRSLTLVAGDHADTGYATVNEYWVVIQGALQLSIDNMTFELVAGDHAVLRARTRRDIGSSEGARLILARE